MYSHESARTGGAEKAARPAHRSGSARPGQPQGLVGLQQAAGNAAVVQLLRQSGHSWAQPDQHQHSAGCGHREESPAVQRSAVHDVLRSGGSPLDQATRTDMETRLGADFSDVRIHRDSAARASAAEVGARAYTSGNHVVIGEGGGDKHTLAHELTHVIQQRRGPVAGTDNGRGLSVSDPGDRFEREAEANATRVMRSSTSLPPRTAEAPAESSGGPAEGAIQRRVSLRDAQNPQSTRELGDEKSVREFLEQHGISVLDSVKARMGASLGVAAAIRVELKATAVIKEIVADADHLVHDDSKAGAEELADVICDRVIASFAAPPAHSAPSTPGAMLRQMNQRQSGDRPGPSSSGPEHGPVADVLSQLARRKMAERTPETPFLSGLASGAKSAVTGRAAGFSEPLPSRGNVSEGMLWTAWVALEGEEKVRQALEQAAQQTSPAEGRRLLAQFDDTLEAKKQEAAGAVVGSVATSQVIGQVANAIPHPGVKAAVKVGSMFLGGLAAARKFGDGADAVQKLEEVSPQTYAKLRSARDQALDQAADKFVARNREHILDHVADMGF
ncbi:DUF4157 domain-containing protein [Streptomyces sp. NPDC060184]|uniref:DUF4157 domain-containing protein n=1 Tax=Streptomyces sp. NPDC060184 TaxID=3347064 RepID=UPI003669515E